LAKHAFELVTAEPDRPDGTIGDERGNPRTLRDGGHLPDGLARAAPRKLALGSLSALDHANRAFDHDVELLSDFALGSDDLAIGVATLFDQFRDTLEVRRRHIREQGHLAEEQHAFDYRERRDGTWHGTSIPSGTDDLCTLADERILVLQCDGHPLAVPPRGGPTGSQRAKRGRTSDGSPAVSSVSRAVASCAEPPSRFSIAVSIASRLVASMVAAHSPDRAMRRPRPRIASRRSPDASSSAGITTARARSRVARAAADRTKPRTRSPLPFTSVLRTASTAGSAVRGASSALRHWS